MRLLRVFPAFMLVLVLAANLFAQDKPQDQATKTCVAAVANASTTSAFVERLTERLVRSLKQNKVNAVLMDSGTTSHYPLQINDENGHESQQKECDYILLTQIRDPRQHPLEPHIPEISIGGRVPSVDASDPLGGSSGTVYRENLQVAFALFRIGRHKPVLDTDLLERPKANVSDTLLPAMDKEANRVSYELKKTRLPE